MVSFELSKEKRKMSFVLSEAWDKENILFPHEESNLRPLNSLLQSSTTEPQRLVSEVYYKVHMTHVLHTVRISNVDSIMFVNRIR